MAETFKKETAPGFLHVENRKELRAGGIEHVETCDSHLVTARIHMGRLAVRGAGLTMQKLDAEKGEMTLLGRIDSVQYLGGRRRKNRRLFQEAITVSAGKQVLVFLLMGGALSLFYSACGLLWRPWGKNGQYAGCSMACLPWGLCFYGLFCPCGAGKGASGLTSCGPWRCRFGPWNRLSGGFPGKYGRWARGYPGGGDGLAGENSRKKPHKQKKSLERRNQSSV